MVSSAQRLGQGQAYERWDSECDLAPAMFANEQTCQVTNGAGTVHLSIYFPRRTCASISKYRVSHGRISACVKAV